MSRFLSPRLQVMDPYVPGEQPRDRQYLKLNTNESPYPPSPLVLEAVSRAEVRSLRLYSDPECRALVQAAADYYGLRPGQVAVGNGSDELLAFAFSAFGGDGAAYPAVSYGFYPVFARMAGVEGREIPLREGFRLDPRDYMGCGRMVVIANPNAPTGLALTPEEIEPMLRSNPDHVVVVDEAYVDFGAQSCVPLLERYDNLLVVQTCSKSRCLAGARVGFALGSPELIADLNRLKFSFNPYNVNRLSLAAGAAALADRAYFQDCTRRIAATRQRTARALEELGFQVIPSLANFLFVRPAGLSGAAYFQALRERGVLIRRWDKPEIADFVRVTIGSEAEMEAFLTITKEVCGHADQ